MTLAVGRRVVIVEGVERWREADVEEHAGERARADAAGYDARVVRARGGAREGAGGAARGGQAGRRTGASRRRRSSRGSSPSGRASRPPGSACARRRRGQGAGRPGRASASSGCCARSRSWRSHVSGREGRAVAPGLAQDRGQAPIRVSAQDIEERAAHSSEWRAYALADALVGADDARGDAHLPAPAPAGRAPVGPRLPDRRAAARRARGGRAPEAGESVAEVKRSLRMPAARRRALRRGRRPQRPRAAAGGARQRSPSSSSTPVAARRCSQQPQQRSAASTRTRSRCARSKR